MRFLSCTVCMLTSHMLLAICYSVFIRGNLCLGGARNKAWYYDLVLSQIPCDGRFDM